MNESTHHPASPVQPATAGGISRRASRPSRARFQFSLRTLLLAVAACGVLIAVMQQVGPIWSVAIGWFLVLVAAHVTANARGSRFGRAPDETPPVEDADWDVPSAQATTTTRGAVFAPATRLSQSTKLGWIMFALTALGAIGGGAAGVTALALSNWDRIGASGILVGGASCSVLGGFLGFLTSTFLGISMRALRDAARDSRPPVASVR